MFLLYICVVSISVRLGWVNQSTVHHLQRHFFLLFSQIWLAYVLSFTPCSVSPFLILPEEQMCLSPLLSSLPLLCLAVFVWDLCGIWGKQVDSPESQRHIPNTRHLTLVSEDPRSDTWLLDCPPRGLSAQQPAQTQWSMGEEEEEEEINSWGNHVLCSILPCGRSIEWKLAVLQWLAVAVQNSG